MPTTVEKTVLSFDELLSSVKEAARDAEHRKERIALKPATIFTIADRLSEVEGELEEVKAELKESKEKVEELEESEEDLQKEVDSLECPSGMIRFDIRSAGHAIDELAAEKLEEIINRIGLDTAADILSRNV